MELASDLYNVVNVAFGPAGSHWAAARQFVDEHRKAYAGVVDEDQDITVENIMAFCDDMTGSTFHQAKHPDGTLITLLDSLGIGDGIHDEGIVLLRAYLSVAGADVAAGIIWTTGLGYYTA